MEPEMRTNGEMLKEAIALLSTVAIEWNPEDVTYGSKLALEMMVQELKKIKML